MIHGYYNDPESNRTAFHSGWLRTGDLGRQDGEGYLYVTGRIKDIINRGGEKVLPGEIEEALMAHPAVLEAVAFGVPHPTLGEDVTAAAVLNPGATVTESELRRFAGGRIADFKLPRRIVFVNAIPKGAIGKPARSELAAEFELNRLRIPSAATTGDPTIEILRDIWKDVLQCSEVAENDSFTESGGDSLSAVRVLIAIHERFGYDAAPDTLHRFPTLKLLANHVDEADRGDPEARSLLVFGRVKCSV